MSGALLPMLLGASLAVTPLAVAPKAGVVRLVGTARPSASSTSTRTDRGLRERLPAPKGRLRAR